MKIQKVKDSDVRWLIIDQGTHYVVRTGNIKHICDSLGISVPIFDMTIPLLVKSKYNIPVSKIKFLDSEQYTKFSKRIADSGKQIRFE